MLYNEETNRFGPENISLPSSSANTSEEGSDPNGGISFGSTEIESDSTDESTTELQAGCASFKIPVVTGYGRLPEYELESKGNPSGDYWGEAKKQLDEQNSYLQDIEDYLFKNIGPFKTHLEQEAFVPPTEITEGFNWAGVMCSPAIIPTELVGKLPEPERTIKKPKKRVALSAGKPALAQYAQCMGVEIDLERDGISEEERKEAQREAEKKKGIWRKPRPDTPGNKPDGTPCKRPDTPRPGSPGSPKQEEKEENDMPEVEFVEERRITRKSTPPPSPPALEVSRRVVEYDPTDGPSSKRSRNHSRGREPSPRRDREPKRSWRRERNMPREPTPDRRTYQRQDSKEGRRERRGQTYKPRSSRRRT